MIALPPLEALVPLIAGGAGLGYVAWMVASALRAQSWPSVEGEIAATRLVRRETTDDDGFSREHDYQYVSYRYSVAGQPYRNDRVAFGPLVAPRSILPGDDPEPDAPEAAAQLAREYPRGQRVRVRYNPRDPAESVRDPSVAGMVWIIALIAGLAVWVGIGQL